MALKTLVLYVVALMAAQFVLIAVITRRNKNIMDQFKANSYGLALKELAKRKPLSVLAIRVCYAAALVELLIVIFAKYW